MNNAELTESDLFFYFIKLAFKKAGNNYRQSILFDLLSISSLNKKNFL
jgi:hypothetical protein